MNKERASTATLGYVLDRFSDPPRRYRPLQMIHDFTHYRDQGLEPDELVNLLVLRGCGGAVTNVAWGDDYLSNESAWKDVRRGIRLLKRAGLSVWIYDEKGYPSGTAGGAVLRGHPEWQALGVFCMGYRPNSGERIEVPLPPSAGEWVHATAFPLLERDGSVTIDHVRGSVVSCEGGDPIVWTAPDGAWVLLCFATRRIFDGTIAASEYGWSDDGYLNLLSKEAVEEFCSVTHARYAEKLGNLWDHVDAVFTDEPALQSAYVLFSKRGEEEPAERAETVAQFIESGRRSMRQGAYPPTVAWERRMPEWFSDLKGYDLTEALPALFLDLPGARRVRYDFYDVVAQRVADSYAGTIRRKCDALGTASSGHLLAEDFLHQHVVFEGDLFRSLRSFHIPGVDIIAGKPEPILNGTMFLIPKFAASVARACGAPRVMVEHWDFCERYGFLDPWPLSMEEGLCTLGLLFAMGMDCLISYMPFLPFQNPIEQRLEPQVPREQQPFGPEYRVWTDCAGRLSLLVQGGRQVCDIAVYYPIEGVQAYVKPCGAYENQRETEPAIRRIEDTWLETCRALVRGQKGFTIVDDQAGADGHVEDGCLTVADARYRLLILTHTPFVPIRVLEQIALFARRGGLVLTVGPLPEDCLEPGEERTLKEHLATIRAAATAADRPDEVPGLIESLLVADIVIDPPALGIVALHTRHPDRETYLLVNTQAQPVQAQVSLASIGPAYLLRPASGAVESLTTDVATCELQFAGYEVLVVVAGRAAAAGSPSLSRPSSHGHTFTQEVVSRLRCGCNHSVRRAALPPGCIRSDRHQRHVRDVFRG